MAEIIMTSERNDCSVCAASNLLSQFGVTGNREEIKKHGLFNPEIGGFADIAIRKLSEQYGLKYEIFPKDKDLIFRQVSEHIRRAFPEDNAKILLSKYIERLKAGWKAVTTIKWESGEGHCIALIGTTGNKVIIADSVKGIYEMGEELFYNPEGKMQAGIFTCWVVRDD
jgi:hypothetical protein